MATTNPLYGKLMTLRLGGTQVNNLLSNDLELERDLRDVTTKDSGDWREIRPKFKAATIPFTGIFSQTAAQNFEAWYDEWDTGSEIAWKQGTGVSGDTFWSGSGFITSLKFSAPFDGNVEMSGTVTVSGQITKGTED
jgi:predicted secreted protein